MEEKTSYYLILTSSVIGDERLSDFEKILYARITGLTHSTGECFASNSYFAKTCNASISKIKRSLNHLKECGYI